MSFVDRFSTPAVVICNASARYLIDALLFVAVVAVLARG